jgi:hypothetical protein
MKRRELLSKMAGLATVGAITGTANVMANDKPKSKPGADDAVTHSTSSHVFFASRIGAKLDSNVLTGGGTDDTTMLQALLDKAPELGSLHLIMDGAALIKGLNIHANTTIECLNKSCGFFLAGQSNRSVVKNANPDMKGERKDKNISLIGGTYNHNCKDQVHHLDNKENAIWVIAFEFYGVENFTMRDVTICNQRTFAILMANWYRVNLENITIDLPDHMDAQNQDGLHFWGPGQFLTMRNIQGCAGDDFIALAPDENDEVSSITDVLIDGVILNNADQGIRILSRGDGRIDRVIIKNITGTYKSFGFYLDHWFEGKGGNYGNMIFDTIDLRTSKPNYDYTSPFLFRLGGNYESLTFRNIYMHNPEDNRSFLDIGWPNPDQSKNKADGLIKSLQIDGLHIYESNERSADTSYIKALGIVDNFVIRNVEIIRDKAMPQKGCLLETQKESKIGRLFMNGILMNRMKSLISHNEGPIDTLQISNAQFSEVAESVISIGNGTIQQLNADAVYGAKLVSSQGTGKVEKTAGTSI